MWFGSWLGDIGGQDVGGQSINTAFGFTSSSCSSLPPAILSALGTEKKQCRVRSGRHPYSNRESSSLRGNESKVIGIPCSTNTQARKEVKNGTFLRHWVTIYLSFFPKHLIKTLMIFQSHFFFLPGKRFSQWGSCLFDHSVEIENLIGNQGFPLLSAFGRKHTCFASGFVYLWRAGG